MTFHQVCNKGNSMDVISGVGSGFPSGAPAFTPVFSGISVALQFSVQCFLDYCLSFCPFSVDHWSVLLRCTASPLLVSSDFSYIRDDVVVNRKHYCVSSKQWLSLSGRDYNIWVKQIKSCTQESSKQSQSGKKLNFHDNTLE